jgi:hypothetical protein
MSEMWGAARLITILRGTAANEKLPFGQFQATKGG